MKLLHILGLGFIVAILAGILGFFTHRLLDNQGTTDSITVAHQIKDEVVIGKLRPEFQLPDIEGNVRDVSEWKNRVLVINFWATWCPPCLEEIPEFVRLQNEHGAKGLQFIGIAIEQLKPVQEFAERYQINYPVLQGESDAIKIAERYGNRIGALPYTVFIDRSGQITSVKHGPVSIPEAEELIISLL